MFAQTIQETDEVLAHYHTLEQSKEDSLDEAIGSQSMLCCVADDACGHPPGVCPAICADIHYAPRLMIVETEMEIPQFRS